MNIFLLFLDNLFFFFSYKVCIQFPQRDIVLYLSDNLGTYYYLVPQYNELYISF